MILDKLIQKLEKEKKKLYYHEMYSKINRSGIEGIRLFQEHHVWIVFDYFQLLKRLQREFTSIKLPWRPFGNTSLRRFINEIVLEEESDIYEDGKTFGSHLELYIRGMEQTGANVIPIKRFLQKITTISLYSISNQPNLIYKTIVECGGPIECAKHVSFTLNTAMCGNLSEVVGLFTFGRENIIPCMFSSLLPSITKMTTYISIFKYYLERHIELDGGTHGPLAIKMVEKVLENGGNINDIEKSAVMSLNYRKELWNSISKKIDKIDRTNIAKL
jgi:hypothetical protein